VQEHGKPGHDASLSKRAAESPASSGKLLEAHAKDTHNEFLHQDGRGETTENSLRDVGGFVNKADTPDIARAREALPSIPNDRVFAIEHDDGTTESGTAAELMARADDEAAFADKAELATDSAITCFLRFGDLCKLRSEQLDQGGDHRNLCQH